MRRGTLSRKAVIEAAVKLANDDGLSGVTMRRLAASLDVEAMSLYNHVANKQAVIEGIADHVWRQIDQADDATDWRTGVHRVALSSHQSMLAHPWFMSLPVVYGGPARLFVLNAMLSHLRRGGVPAEAAFHAQHAIDGYIFGYTWQAIGYLDTDAIEERGRAMLDAVDTTQLPYLMEHVAQHQEVTLMGGGFEFGLDLLLDSLERTI